MRARKICSKPGCYELQPCPTHPKKAWVKKQDQPDRLRGRKAVARRRRVLERDSFTCYLCGDVRLEQDLIADHVKPLAEGGADTMGNLRCCCVDCHDLKSQDEARRARTPGGNPGGGP